MALTPEVKGGRLYIAVAACAIVAHLGALWNHFAMDDLYIIAWNPLVHSGHGIWRAFVSPYWPPDYGGFMYRPLVLASFALDSILGGAAWLHTVNLLWHAGATLVVAVLARRWAGDAAALGAGLIFAVHPVHVEAIANGVGRAELMAALFSLLFVYAALVRRSVSLSMLALAGGLLSKENAAVAPALVVWGWMLGVEGDRPDRRRILTFAATWVIVVGLYLGIRSAVLHPYARFEALAPVFSGASGSAVRLTAIAALMDITRLLVFPLTLRVDYSPAERTLVSSALDVRFFFGLACLLLWAGLVFIAWRRGRRVEAFGLGWIGIAFIPVANLFFTTGVLIAERVLYLASAGLAIAAGPSLARLRPAQLRIVLALIVLAGGIRSALRVPVWRDDRAVTMSMLVDSPRSYRGPARMAALYVSQREPDRAIASVVIATRSFDGDPSLYFTGADAAFKLGLSWLADTMLTRAERLCHHCSGYYRTQALAARSRGDSAVADSLLARAP